MSIQHKMKTNFNFSKYEDYRLLIVDDDEIICSILEKMITHTGLSVTSISHSNQALAIIKNEEFDVILSDIYMPEISGLKLLSIVDEIYPHTPVIMMTGKPTLDISIEALRSGAFDFLVKPFTSDTVFFTLDRALKFRSVLIENRAYQLHLEKLVDKRTKQLQDFLLQSVKALTKAIEAKDPYTQGHGYNVSRLVVELAKELDVDEVHFLDLTLAAELHDVGKIGIPDTVLMKPGKLTKEEYEKMKEHVSIGYEIISPIPSLKNVSRYVHEHHERMDGKGYPRGLKGGQIHYNSQLLVVAEVCDALAAERCYKPPWHKDDIINYFSENTGTAFHPEVSEALISVLHDRGDDILKMLRNGSGSQNSPSA